MTRGARALTQRQRSVVNFVAQGYGTKEIAVLLGISVHGVKKHVESLLRRYGVSNRPALVMAALVAGDMELHRALGGPIPSAESTARALSGAR
jgi:LuxR family transcriptional regulator, transcriptional regulator of spore coat protein